MFDVFDHLSAAPNPPVDASVFIGDVVLVVIVVRFNIIIEEHDLSSLEIVGFVR